MLLELYGGECHQIVNFSTSLISEWLTTEGLKTFPIRIETLLSWSSHAACSPKRDVISLAPAPALEKPMSTEYRP